MLPLFVLQVSANDPDCQGQIQNLVRYHLDNSTASQPFTVNSVSGQICVSKKLDYETKQSHEFTVFARDSGKNTLLKYLLTHISFALYLTFYIAILCCYRKPGKQCSGKGHPHWCQWQPPTVFPPELQRQCGPVGGRGGDHHCPGSGPGPRQWNRWKHSVQHYWWQWPRLLQHHHQLRYEHLSHVILTIVWVVTWCSDQSCVVNCPFQVVLIWSPPCLWRRGSTYWKWRPQMVEDWHLWHPLTSTSASLDRIPTPQSLTSWLTASRSQRILSMELRLGPFEPQSSLLMVSNQVLTVYSDYPVYIILKKKLKFILIC